MAFPDSFGFTDQWSIKELHTNLLGMVRAHLWLQMLAGWCTAFYSFAFASSCFTSAGLWASHTARAS